MNKIKIKIYLLASLGLAGFGFAQNSRTLTMGEVLQLSVSNNAKIKVAQAKLNTLSANVEEAKEKKLPSLSLSASLMKPFNTLSVKSEIPAIAQSGGASPDYVAFQQLNLGIPLFAGFKIKNGIAVAQYQKSIQEHQLESDKQDVATIATQGFINLYKAQQAIKVIQENLKRAHQRSSDFEKMEKNGLVARNDVMSVKLQESNVKLSLADAERNLKVLNYNLATFLSLPEGTEIVAELGNTDTAILSDISTLQQNSKEKREEYKILKEQEGIAKTQVELAKSAYYPTISATAGYINAWLPSIMQLNHITSVGVALNWDLSSFYKSKSSIEKAKLQQIEIAESQKAVEDQLKTEVYKAYQEYQLSQDKISVYKEALALANENYRVVKNKFDNGLSTTTDLLTSDIDELQAQLNLVYGEADVKWAYFNLQRQSGEIPTFNNEK